MSCEYLPPGCSEDVEDVTGTFRCLICDHVFEHTGTHEYGQSTFDDVECPECENDDYDQMLYV
jgi:rubredoxin